MFYNETSRNSPDHCVRTCRWAGLAYAGLAEGSLCYCDRQLPNFMLPSSRCGTFPCPGDFFATCGGEEALDVFATGVPAEQPPLSLSSLGGFFVVFLFISKYFYNWFFTDFHLLLTIPGVFAWVEGFSLCLQQHQQAINSLSVVCVPSYLRSSYHMRSLFGRYVNQRW